jgi:hypothetical protein
LGYDLSLDYYLKDLSIKNFENWEYVWAMEYIVY